MRKEDKEYLVSRGCSEEVLEYIETMISEAQDAGFADGYDEGYSEGEYAASNDV